MIKLFQKSIITILISFLFYSCSDSEDKIVPQAETQGSYENTKKVIQNTTFQDGVLLLTSDRFRLEVDPATLGTTLQDSLLDLKTILSKPVLEENEYQINESSIFYPQKSLKVNFELSEREIVVSIFSEIHQDVTWPKIEIPKDSHLILPHHEGSYIPLSDPDWLHYLLNNHWNTTESLTMPFWGVETAEHLKTYIAQNPFHNSISFSE